MNTRTYRIAGSVFLLIFVSFFSAAQKIGRVVKIDGLLERTSHPDTVYVVNFWATWCKPCVAELPAFDSLHDKTSGRPVKVLLVSLDFREDIDKKVNPFLAKRTVKSECLLLDETDGNVFINRISPEWSGAIPATLIVKGNTRIFLEKKLTLAELEKNVAVFPLK